MITDSSDNVRNFAQPSKELIDKFDRKISSMKIRAMVTVGGRRKLVNFPEVYFDPTSGTFINATTNAVVSGLERPIY